MCNLSSAGLLDCDCASRTSSVGSRISHWTAQTGLDYKSSAWTALPGRTHLNLGHSARVELSDASTEPSFSGYEDGKKHVKSLLKDQWTQSDKSPFLHMIQSRQAASLTSHTTQCTAKTGNCQREVTRIRAEPMNLHDRTQGGTCAITSSA